MTAAETVEVSYRGLNRRGAGTTGTLDADVDVVDFVRRKFLNRWQFLTVSCGDDTLGEIYRNNVGVRVWWAQE